MSVFSFISSPEPFWGFGALSIAFAANVRRAIDQVAACASGLLLPLVAGTLPIRRPRAVLPKLGVLANRFPDYARNVEWVIGPLHASSAIRLAE